MRLIEALTTTAKDYELLLFPEARHMPRNPTHLEYLERKLVKFLNRHLKA
jgi:dipeptidyl aminopeptidase/acylaminoacyl peptidase